MYFAVLYTCRQLLTLNFDMLNISHNICIGGGVCQHWEEREGERGLG